MKRLLFTFTLILSSLATLAAPARAASGSLLPAAVDWQAHDTAVYVLSTINALRPYQGRLIPAVLRSDLGVARYAVYADRVWQDRYYIDLQRSNGGVVGALAYALGAPTPRSLSRVTSRLGIAAASKLTRHNYRHDPKQLIGLFDTTWPS